MNQSHKKTKVIFPQDMSSVRVAWVQAEWHRSIVDVAYHAFVKEVGCHGISDTQIELFKVPGSFEIPLVIRRLANSKRFDLAVGSGLVVDGGIYRHDFVAQSVVNGLMQVQLETGMPVLSAVLTPHHFHEHQVHEKFFQEHMILKGKEVGSACIQTIHFHHKLAA